MTLGLRVTRISWDHIHVTFQMQFEGIDDQDSGLPEVECALRGDVQFVLQDGGRKLDAETEHLGNGQYVLTINITRFAGRKQLPDGTWRIVPIILEEAYRPATYDVGAADDFPDLSRVFLYESNHTAYTVSFGFTEADDPPVLLMRAYQLFRTGKKPRKKKGPIAKLKKYPKRWTSRKNKSKMLNRFYWTVRHRRDTSKPRILFASEQRTRIEGNLLRIRDRMVERGLDSQFSFGESFRVHKTMNKQSTLRAVYELALADYVFIDDYFALLDSLKLDPNCMVVQVWHAGSGFKAVGYSRFGKYGSPKLNNAHRKYTYAITGSKQLVPVYSEVFGIEESAVIPTGLPRIDSFLDPQRTEDVTAEFYREHPDLQGKRLVLFAPTFRGRGIKDAYYPFDKLDLDELYDYCGEDTVFLFRMHHFVADPPPIPEQYRDRLQDFSHFPNGNDLLHVVDLLITDYSSIIYEYSLLERPMLFFAFDKDVYAATRGFHRDYVETAPCKVCTTFDGLMEAMRNEDYETERRDRFVRENFDHVDTHSADRVIDWLILGEPVGTPVEGQNLIEDPASSVAADAPESSSAEDADDHDPSQEISS